MTPAFFRCEMDFVLQYEVCVCVSGMYNAETKTKTRGTALYSGVVAIVAGCSCFALQRVLCA